jgi:hypothetical protein
MRAIVILLALVFAISAILFGGCAPKVAYQPAAMPTAARPIIGQASGPEVSGDVRVSAVGLVTVRVADGWRGRRTRAVNVRMVLRNRGNTPWLVVANSQTVTFAGWPSAEPLFALSEDAPAPEAVLEPGEVRSIDLYYAVPVPVHPGSTTPTFRVDWRIDGPEGVIARRAVSFAPQARARPRHVAPPVDAVGAEAARLDHGGLARPDRAAADGASGW